MRDDTPMPRLKNAKRERFCHEYVKDLNATAAAKRAGYSKKTAASQAARLLTIVNVLERVGELQNKIKKELHDVLGRGKGKNGPVGEK